MMKQPLIFLTNDDGIRAKGLRALAEMARPLGRLLIVAPEEGNSGQSHAITSKTPLRLRTLPPWYDNAEVYACNGTPVDCIKLAMSHLMNDKPDVVLSGINHGSNASTSVLYSGTLSAAQEGALYGVPAVAFSLLNHLEDADFSNCIDVGQKVIRQVLQKGLSPEICLNVNIPDLPLSEIKGVKLVRQAKGAWMEYYEKRVDPQGHDYFWLTGNFVNHEPNAEDTDEWALQNGYVAITPVHPDLTCYAELDKLKSAYHF
jgi:5'-nucleotidase